MLNGHASSVDADRQDRNCSSTPTAGQLHPGWQAMIQFCRDMGYGEIACIKIYDGVPVSAELVTKKVRWY